MKPYRGYRDFAGGLWFRGRSSFRPLRAAAIALLLLMPSIGTANAVTTPAPGASGAHVYLLRGVLSVRKIAEVKTKVIDGAKKK